MEPLFVKYFASIGYTKDGDVFKTEKQPEYDPTFKYERYNYRTNLDMDVTKYTKISVNLAGDIATRNRPLSYMGRDPFGYHLLPIIQTFFLTCI